MRTALVVPPDPPAYGAAPLDEAWERMLPDALFLEATEEALDHPVLLRRVGRYELLVEAVIFARGAKPPALEDEPVVAAQDRRVAVGP